MFDDFLIRRLIMKRLMFILLVLCWTVYLSAQSMEWLCRPGRFTAIQYMGNDLFKVKNEQGKWGILSAVGKLVVETVHDSITPFVENRSLILGEGGKRILAIVGPAGEILKDLRQEHYYTAIYPYYTEGLLGYKDQNGLCGYLNDRGEVVIGPRFYLVTPFHKGIATVQYADDGAYYGLINRSGGSVIISDTKYHFLSAPVDGLLLAVNASHRGGDLLRVMRLDGARLKTVERLESKMFVDLSDDFTCLISQNGHRYFIDNQWRISGANYDWKLPYAIVDDKLFVTESTELLSKQETQKGGIQITYMGSPILEQSFGHVETYEKRYAIVCSAKDQRIGVLRLNPSAGIEILSPDAPVVFYHNPLSAEVTTNPSTVEPTQYGVAVQVNLKDVDSDQLKCYLNENGYLRYAPLSQSGDVWRLHLPYFMPDVRFNNQVTKAIDIAVTYDGLDWMHRQINVTSLHEAGYEVCLTGDAETNAEGKATLRLVVRSTHGAPRANVRVMATGLKPVVFQGAERVIPIQVVVPEGEQQTFVYTVQVAEEGCPVIEQTVRHTVSHPKPTDVKRKIQLD